MEDPILVLICECGIPTQLRTSWSNDNLRKSLPIFQLVLSSNDSKGKSCSYRTVEEKSEKMKFKERMREFAGFLFYFYVLY
ncbi:hypothetical protein GQ457_10G008030 [Hibiscus cannabinus]